MTPERARELAERFAFDYEELGVPAVNKLSAIILRVAAEERERCAKVCEKLSEHHMMSSGQDALYCAESIREGRE